MNGEYKEKLSDNFGELIVTKNSWSIRYYFPGIDLRHNGTFVQILENEVDKYIKAYKENWEIYLETKKNTANNLEIRIIGEGNMNIFVNGYFDGICIQSCHMPINKEEELNNLLQGFEKAKDRAKVIMDMIRKLD